jgi:hypothetical protein
MKNKGKAICGTVTRKTGYNEEIDVEESEKPQEKLTEKNDNMYIQWMIKAGNYYPAGKIITKNKLKPGIYSINWDGNIGSFYFVKNEVYLDELLYLPVPVFTSILEDMKFFWKSEDKFKKYKYAYKRGILLYGEPGCGKTCLTALLSNEIIKLGGLVFSLKNQRNLSDYIESIPAVLRVIEPNTPILTIIEDLDGLLQSQDTETALLNLLDGFNQINNVTYLGLTNYPEKLKERILNRPSRFDRRYHVGLPEANIREFYFRNKINKDDLNEEIIKKLVEKSEGLSIAHLGEIIKSVFIFGKDIDETIEDMKDMKKHISSTNLGKSTKSIGYGNEKE